MLFINQHPVEITKFPDGTSKFTCEAFLMVEQFVQRPHGTLVTWLYDNDAELFTLQCIVDWLHSNGYRNIALSMPYVPNARMDRVPNNEMFTLKTFAKLINSMNFTEVHTLDIHSNVGAALIDNIVNHDPVININMLFEENHIPADVTMFFPDEGAMKRYSGIAKEFHRPYVFGMKNRDWKTGEIKGLSVLGETETVNDKDILIIDDICSRGGTFYHSAKALKDLGAKNIYLYVSHLENTVHDGEMITSGLIQEIFTTDSIYRADAAPVPGETLSAKIRIIDSYNSFNESTMM